MTPPGGPTDPCSGFGTLQRSCAWQLCSYLPGRVAQLVGRPFSANTPLPPEDYDRLLSLNYRRSGRLVYRPECPACQACRSLRVPTERFRPSRSQRRILRRNTDVRVEIRPPRPTRESYRVYERYLAFQHDGRMNDDPEAFTAFLYDSPTDTVEIQYRVGTELMAVGIADRVPSGFSSVYVFFEPRFARRSPGSFTALWEIEHCRRSNLPYYYLGYYIEGSPKMMYKASFRPCEVLDPDGTWRPFEPAVKKTSPRVSPLPTAEPE